MSTTMSAVLDGSTWTALLGRLYWKIDHGVVCLLLMRVALSFTQRHKTATTEFGI